MRNQPPQSYNNDEMTVLSDSDTRTKRRHSPPALLPTHSTSALFSSPFLKCLSFCRLNVIPIRFALPIASSSVRLLPSRHFNTLCRDDDLFFPQNIDPDYYESSRLLASTVLIEPDRHHAYTLLSHSFFNCLIPWLISDALLFKKAVFEFRGSAALHAVPRRLEALMCYFIFEMKSSCALSLM